MTRVLLSVAALLAPGVALAGAGIPGGGSCSFPTIQAAINAAAANTGPQTILVEPFVTHRENLIIDASTALWSTLTLDAGDTSCDAVGLSPASVSGDTDADGTPDGHVLHVKGMTVTEIVTGSRRVFVNNHALSFGGPGPVLAAGAVVVERAGVTLTASTVLDSDAGAMGLGGGVFATDDAAVLVTGSLLDTLDAEYGGAIAATDGATVTVIGSTVRIGTAIEDGGLVYADDADVLIFAASDLLTGVAAGGGCVAAVNGALVVLQRDVTVHDCTAAGRGITAAGTSFGGGAFVEDSELAMVINAQIFDSEADRGGGVYVTGEAGKLTMAGTPRVRDNASHGPGGGVFATDHAFVEITGLDFTDPQREELTAWHAMIAGNMSWMEPTEAMGHGAGAYIEDGATFDMEAAAIADNATALGATRRGMGGGLFVTGATAELSNSTIHRNTAQEGGGIVVGPDADVGLVATPLETVEPFPDLCAELVSTGLPAGRACTEVYGNRADDGPRGAAILVQEDGVLTAEFTAIRRNRVEDSVSEGTRAIVWIEPGGFMSANSMLIADNGAARILDPGSGADDSTVSVEIEAVDEVLFGQ
ncbi:MAG: hypothetical protein ACI9K2_007312, partial [Myxococcota bacterium]